ncbi:histone-lysine N-methyltransferase EHMT1 [Cydia fagiglandana]|uniref:histone-lysine N-methyltransferase EHMT1 n=1 Tax=Cydia fagiglandana TaxID=1458189 RepID=UPI002FEE50D7
MQRPVDEKCDSEAQPDLERSSNMLAAPDHKKKTELDNSDAKPKASEEDPKPRIVLTFRSEKTGTRSSNMKIVSAEEKQEEISPRRSTRIRIPVMWDSEEETEFTSPKKEKAVSSVSENEEASDGSTPKRSTRRRSKEFSDNVIANAIARKEKYNDPGPPKRPSRQIKPTPKVLGNKELRWLQSQPQSNVIDRSEEGVMTRRSARRRSFEAVEEKKVEKVFEEEEDIEAEEMELEEAQTEEAAVQSNNVKKLKHLCELGLRAINPAGLSDSQEAEDRDEDMEELEDEELDEELISKLAEAETGSDEDEDDDDEFFCAADASCGERPRRSTRLCSGYGEEDEEMAEDGKSQPRRSSRIPKSVEYLSDTESSRNPAGADDTEAAYPDEESGVTATCYCEATSNVYASPKDLDAEPVFCQAVDLVDGIRVGCSHSALRTPAGLAPLVRSGPRAPYVLACEQHNRQLRLHMACAACGCFCTQGVFYRCNKNHYFHVDCGISSDPKQKPGCPHCGVYSYRWQPVNRECHRVRITAKCSNKRVFLPDQRVQCTPAYLGFSTLDPTSLEQDPIIPPDLLPTLTVDLEGLRTRDPSATDAGDLYPAILAGAKADELLPMIVSCPDINKPVTPSGGTVAHAAARRGHLAALYLAQYAGANMDAEDARSLTPLMCAVRALSKKTQSKPKHTDSDVEMDADPESEKEDDKSETGSDEELLKVIRYLVAAGCDANLPGPEGMTALHTAARYGHKEACAAILGSARSQVDPRDHGGWTPLVWAAEHSHAAVVRLLLEHGADPTAMDIEGNAAAHWCALAGHGPCLRLLVEASPRAVAAVNAHRDTPLHVAARQGHYACVVILLAHGARTDVENIAGELPVEVCTGQCQSAISLNMQMAIASREQLTRYKMLSSDISNGREPHPVPCVNEVDDTPAPADFTYVVRHVTPRRVDVDDTIDTLQGCSCTDGTCSADTCSCQLLGVRRWFHKGRLVPDFPYHEPPMLFQCNHTCGCNKKLCTNSVVTRATENGSMMIRACVFRAGGSKGWGLRATAKVLRGSPVATYCGELLSMGHADTRSPDHYMFALDVKPDLLEQCEYKVQLCVDAARYGSAARFINHSCQPNLAPVRVFTGSRDLRLPAVCLFATRDIAPGEELAFDYGDKFWSVKSKWMKCECGSPECRYPHQSTDDE